MSLFGRFKRKVGPAADLRELEYISALHQTPSVLHTDGTVSAEDVRIFLRSRFGLDITGDDAIDIVKGLSGTTRLPLPTEEKQSWMMFGGSKQEAKEGRPRKNKCLHRLRVHDDDEEDQLAGVEAQWESMQKSDARKAWEFPGMQRQVRREVPANVAQLVRFDMVEMMAMLLIPSLMRIERHRFKETKETPETLPPVPYWEQHKFFRRTWQVGGLAWKVFKIPIVYVQQARHRRLSAVKESLRPKQDTLFLDVLKILLGSLEERNEPTSTLNSFIVDDSTTFTGTTLGRSCFPELNRTVVTKDLVRSMLEHYQQVQASQDEELIEQMVEAAGGEGAILDEHAFASALTSDVKRWPVECEDDVSTTFYDVYGFPNIDCNKMAEVLEPEDLLQTCKSKDENWTAFDAIAEPTLQDDASESSFYSAETEACYDEEVGMDVGSEKPPSEGASTSSNEQRPRRMGKIPEYRRAANYIDYASDAFRSVNFVVFLFAFFLALSIYALAAINASGITDLRCEESFMCKLSETIYNWLIIALILSFGGILIIAPISLVNQPYLRSLNQAAISIALLLCFISLPFLELFLVRYVGVPVSEDYKVARTEDANLVIVSLFLFSGILTLLEALRSLGSLLLPKPVILRSELLRQLFVPVDIRRTSIQKRAGTYKINKVIDHAYRLQRKAHKKTKARNADNETMMCFLLYGEKEENCGGFFWTWARMLWKRGEGKKEGLWTHSRLCVGQMGQFLVMVAYVILWLTGTQTLVARADEKRAEIESDGGVGSETALYFIPESWMIRWSFLPGGSITLFMLVLLLLVPFPHTQSTIMKYRCGVLPSLHDPTFQYYRHIAAYIYYNTGNMIYAAIGAGAVFFILFAGLLFLLFWPPTSNFMILVLAWGIGLGVTVCLKMVLIMICGQNYWKSFFRKRPLAANFSSLGYECWNIGLGGGVMISRLCQFLLAAAFWIGRIDSALLSADVAVFGYRFDTVPQKYIAEVLIHEAHRHPFMERLAAMYLMRLKHGEYFGSDAGAQWRNLFVLALMPWMMKYSTGRSVDVDEESEEDEYAALDEGLPPIPDDEMATVTVSGNVPWKESSDSSSPPDSRMDSDVSNKTAPFENAVNEMGQGNHSLGNTMLRRSSGFSRSEFFDASA